MKKMYLAAVFMFGSLSIAMGVMATALLGPAVLMVGTATVAVAGEAEIVKNLESSLPGAKVSKVSGSAIAGLYTVELSNGQVFHSSNDGRYIVVGDMFEIGSGQVRNITEASRAAKRVDLLKSLKDEDLVVFPATGVEKGVVYAFTDTSCGYCVKFHSEVPELNSRGITVKYLAWPRAGAKSAPGQQLAAVWCADDRRAAMNNAKSRKPVPEAGDDCSDKVIRDQVNLGRQMGVDGTPALFDKAGNQLGGYVPADALVEILTR